MPWPPKMRITNNIELAIACCVSHTTHIPQNNPENSVVTPATSSLSHSTKSHGSLNDSSKIDKTNNIIKTIPIHILTGIFKKLTIEIPIIENHPKPPPQLIIAHIVNINATHKASPNTLLHNHLIHASQL